jgi:hypothetical protein
MFVMVTNVLNSLIRQLKNVSSVVQREPSQNAPQSCNVQGPSPKQKSLERTVTQTGRPAHPHLLRTVVEVEVEVEVEVW